MKWPKLKQPRLCRIMSYVAVLGCGLLPIVAAFMLPLPDLVLVAVVLGSLVGLLVYLVRNFLVLMTMDMGLAMFSCHQTARTKYFLTGSQTVDVIRKRVLRYGAACAPVALPPLPSALRYKFSPSWTIYAKGIERVVAAYEIDLLDPARYRAILDAAKANSRALEGKKKQRFLDSAQKKAPLHRVTVVLILAHRVDPKLAEGLYELVCRGIGDENENCVLPCVVDLAQGSCVFDGMRMPYVGFGYAVKNRGIRLIRKLVFGGDLNLRGNENVVPIKDYDPEQTLWAFWGELRKMAGQSKGAEKRLLKTMEEREIRMMGDCLYLKWEGQLVCQAVELDEERKLARVEEVSHWYHPKVRPIGKKTIARLEEEIRGHFARLGYRAEFVSVEDLMED